MPAGVKRIGNKDPEHGMVLSGLAQHFPGATFIHVIRGPRDISVSTWRHMRRTEPGFAGEGLDLTEGLAADAGYI